MLPPRIQLAAGALDAAAPIPRLGPLASYFKVLADAVTAIAAANALRDMEGMRFGTSAIGLIQPTQLLVKSPSKQHR
jgi:hypothetical protein